MAPRDPSEASGLSLGCANKDLDGFLGPLCKFIEYCRIVALLPFIPFEFLGPLCKFIEYCRIVAMLPFIPLGYKE